MPKVTIQIDPLSCILAANCVGVEPRLFQIGGESHVEVIDGKGISQGTVYTFDATDAEFEMADEAAESCRLAPSRSRAADLLNSLPWVINFPMRRFGRVPNDWFYNLDRTQESRPLCN